MRIMILANNDVGLYKFRKELIKELAKKHEVWMCLPDGIYIEKLTDMGAKFIPCTLLDRRGTNFVKDLKLLKFYKKIIKEKQPDKVLTYTIKPNVYGGMVCASCGIPYIANITGLGTALEGGGVLQTIALFLYRAGLKKAAMVFFQNTENRDFMLSHNVVRGRYDLLPGSGVNIKEYSLLEYPDGEEIQFLFVARVMKEKGIDQYLEAAKFIRKKYPNTRFHICGACEQDYKKRLEDMQEQGVIVYHSLVDDMVSMYRMTSCTVHPTYYPEGLSNVLLESCASGRPIITTNRPGCREIVDDGSNGYVVKEKDSNDLIAVLEKFLSLSYDDRRKMGLNARDKVVLKFDRDIVIQKYLKELNTNERS